jgi:ABC-type thiamin/hydroxymethylpyrimidine transport system permease subunit
VLLAQRGECTVGELVAAAGERAWQRRFDALDALVSGDSQGAAACALCEPTEHDPPPQTTQGATP